MLRIILPSLVCLARFFCPRYAGRPIWDTPQSNGKNFLLASPHAGHTAQTQTAPQHSGGQLPATKFRGAAKTKARYRTAGTETPTLLHTRQPGPAGEAPDHSRKIAVGKSEIAEDAQKNERDRRLQSILPLGPEPACLDGKP